MGTQDRTRNRIRFGFVSFVVVASSLAFACTQERDEHAARESSAITHAPTGTAHTSSWAAPSAFTGRVAPNEALALHVHLRPRDEAGAAAELAAVSDPKSPRFRQFLSREAWNAKYAPSEADVAEVRAHLEAHGLKVTHVPDNRAFIAVEGIAARVSEAFGTDLGSFKHQAETRRAPLGDLKLPDAIHARVLAVQGLASPTKMLPHHIAARGLAPAVGTHLDPGDPFSCSPWFGATAFASAPAYGDGMPGISTSPCGYRPAQVRRAYGLNEVVRGGNDGRGVSIAVVDAYLSPTLTDDVNAYTSINDGDYPFGPAQLSVVTAPGTPTPPDPGWYIEQTLDVEAAHATAPGATIIAAVAQSATAQDLTAAINVVVDQELATIVANSYGTRESSPDDFVVFHAVATEAGLKGIGLYFSSGDSGDEASAPDIGPATPTTDFPASLDNATAVGGTSLAIGEGGERLWESGWEMATSVLLPFPDDGGISFTWTQLAFQGGSGGGTSRLYEQPVWQKGIVPDAIATLPGTPARTVPDVAMLADLATGFLLGVTQHDDDTNTDTFTQTPIGGTSLACPLFAGVMALAEQRAQARMGFANPALYAASNYGAFRDITPQVVPPVALFSFMIATFDFQGTTLHTAAGYDNVTGLGAPEGEAFLNALR